MSYDMLIVYCFLDSIYMFAFIWYSLFFPCELYILCMLLSFAFQIHNAILLILNRESFDCH